MTVGSFIVCLQEIETSSPALFCGNKVPILFCLIVVYSCLFYPLIKRTSNQTFKKYLNDFAWIVNNSRLNLKHSIMATNLLHFELHDH